MFEDRPWQEKLLVVLMATSGAAWVALAALDLLSPWTGRWLPDWPFAAVLLVGALEIVGAVGVHGHRWWGWTLALLFVGVGVASLLSQLATLFGNGDSFFFMLNTLGLLSLNWLIRSRPRFQE